LRLRDDDGQALVLALGFLVFFGLVIGALMSFVGTSVLSTQRLREQRATAYAADGAVDAAIQAGRSDGSVGAFGATPCMHSAPFTNTASPATTGDPKEPTVVVTVTCVANQGAFTDRDVTFTACVSVNGTDCSNATKLVVAEVHYLDNIDTSVPPVVDVLRWTYCGHDAGTCP
jgi:hypothetical protein